MPPALDGRGPAPFRLTNEGTAIITLVGEFVNRGAWIGASSGLISYEGFKHQIEQAARDPRVRNILLDMESPGGEAVGCFEAAAMVRDAAKVKPVVALVNGMAASAAYALASGATRVIAAPTGISGSIGVVMLHLDFSQLLSAEGIKPTLIFAGAHKVDGNPFEPLPEAVRADFQREIDSFYDQFVGTVAAGRAGLDEKEIRATEARVYKGAAAVDAGLADAVGTFEDVLAAMARTGAPRAHAAPQPAAALARLNARLKGSTAFTRTVTRTVSRAPAPAVAKPQENTMELNEALADAAAPAVAKIETTAAELAAAYPTLVAAIQAAAKLDGAAAERTRIAGIDKLAMPGHEKLIADCKADTACSPEAAAVKIVEAHKAKLGQQLAAIRGVETEGVKVPAAPNADAGRGAGDKPDSEKSDEDFKAEYAAGPKDINKAVTSEAAYLALRRAEASGRVRVLRNKSAA
ncbi:MAG: S49 family peptidase [Phycisphaeraceae bacterium]